MAEKRESNIVNSEETDFVGTEIFKRCMSDCFDLKPNQIQTVIELFKEYQGKKKDNTIGQLKVDIDCSEALKGLKAVTREAKNATVALKELEEQQTKVNNVENYNQNKIVINYESDILG